MGRVGAGAVSESLVPDWAWWALGGAIAGGMGAALLLSGHTPGFDMLMARAGAPKELFGFGAIQRFTESRGNPKAGLGKPELFPTWAQPRATARDKQVAEANAAATAYDRNAKTFEDSPYPRYMWVFGSGGAYGLLPANALAPWKGTAALMMGRVGPYDVFNPWKSTVFFLEYVRRLIDRDDFRALPEAHQNVLALKRGMASPALMSDFEETKARSGVSRRNAEKACASLGIPARYLSERVPLRWPKYRGGTELLA